MNKLFESIGEKVEKLISGGSRPVILVSSQIRRQVQSFMEPVLPDISILAYSELSSEVNLKSVGAVRYPNET